ncbi:MAG: hypothetical protein ACK5A0_00935 [Polaromonas sp.]|jgi:hypothetical protein
MANPNMALLVAIAQAMGPVCDQLVFVGGCATGLLVDDAGLMDVRPTEDVDAIVEVASLAGYHRLTDQLMQRGFKFEAFKDRGQNDVYLSHDLEDILTVIEGRSTVASEVNAASAEVRWHVGRSVAALLDMPAFHNALPGILSEPEREQTVKARLNQIALLKEI